MIKIKAFDLFKKIITVLLMLVSIYMAISQLFMSDIINVFASSQAEIVMEVNSNRVVHAVNENSKKYMASTTKILTAISVIENCNLNDVVEISSKTVGIEGSSIYLEAGEKLSVKDLLYGLMLRSGNDCAESLAVHCAGSIEKFAIIMNDLAKKIGAINSNFVNPHGLHDDNHYTTAYDLALISCYAMKNADFREIVGTKSVKIPFSTRNTVRLLINKNKMLNEFDGSTGIKTGYTKKAGRCLVSSSIRNGIEFVCVVLNCPPMFERSKQLLSSALENFRNYKLVESDNILAFVDVENGEKYPAIIKSDIIYPLSDFEKNNIEIVIELPQKLSLPLKSNKEIGFIKFYCKNNLLFQEKIYTII